MAKYQNIVETIGRTPVVRINRLGPEGIDLYAKIEAFNPLGSVKDRLALGVIEAAENSGALKPGQTVIEATSGNTGIGLAMVCAQRGYPLVIVMAESFSVERRRLMRFLGARLITTPAAGSATGMIDKTRELAEANGWFWVRQFENEANPDYHSKTTAVEILEDFPNGSLDYWVTGYGTGGTLRGVSRVLAEKSPNTRIIVAEPDAAALLASGEQQARNPDGTPSAKHPGFAPHPMQGWVPNFIPKITEEALESGLISELMTVTGPEALKTARDLAQKEGIFVGISAGATMAAALRLAAALKLGANTPPGTSILAMLPDTGERYLSTPLFADIDAEMNEEERAILKATPLYSEGA